MGVEHDLHEMPSELLRPVYYNQGGIEPRHIIEAYNLNFNVGNVLKYILRQGKKTDSPITDIQKAIIYLQFELERLRKS